MYYIMLILAICDNICNQAPSDFVTEWSGYD